MKNKIIGLLLLMAMGTASASVDLSVIKNCDGNVAVRVIDDDVVLFITPNVLTPKTVEANPELQQYLMSVYSRADEVLTIIDTCVEKPITF